MAYHPAVGNTRPRLIAVAARRPPRPAFDATYRASRTLRNVANHDEMAGGPGAPRQVWLAVRLHAPETRDSFFQMPCAIANSVSPERRLPSMKIRLFVTRTTLGSISMNDPIFADATKFMLK